MLIFIGIDDTRCHQGTADNGCDKSEYSHKFIVLNMMIISFGRYLG